MRKKTDSFDAVGRAIECFFGGLLIFLGVAHGWHVLNLEYRSVSSINAGRFFAYEDLDRLAASGVLGKYLVFLLDSLSVVVGLNVVFNLKLFPKRKAERKKPRRRAKAWRRRRASKR